MKRLLTIHKDSINSKTAVTHLIIDDFMARELKLNMGKPDKVLMIANGPTPDIIELDDITAILEEGSTVWFNNAPAENNNFHKQNILTKKNSFIFDMGDTITQAYAAINKCWELQFNNPDLEKTNKILRDYWREEISADMSAGTALNTLTPTEFGAKIMPGLDSKLEDMNISNNQSESLEDLMQSFMSMLMSDNNTPEK